MPLTEQEEFELLSLEREKYQQQSNQSQQPQQQGMGNDVKLLGALAGAGAIAGGYGAYRGVQKLMVEPQIKKGAMVWEKQKVLNELLDFQKQLGIEGTEPSYVPKKLSEMQSQVGRNLQRQQENIKYNTDLAIKNHKIALENFDNKLLNTNVENLSKTVKENFPNFARNVSKAYKTGMDAIEGVLEQSDTKFDALKYNTDVLDKTIGQAIGTGSLENELTPLLQAKNLSMPKFDAQGMMIDTPTSFSQMKGFVSSIVKQDPYGKVSTLLKKNWGEFLEQNAPPEVQQQLSTLNKAFKPFAEARTRLSKIMDTRTGEYDYKGLNKYFLDYAKSNIDNGTQNLMELLGKGNDLVTKIQGVQEQFNNLSELKSQRGILKETLPAMKQNQQEALQQISLKAQNEIDKIVSWKSKAGELVSKLKSNQEMIDKTNLMAIPSKILKLGSRAIPYLSIAPMILQAQQYSKDPEGVLAEILGAHLAPKGSEERDIQTGRLI